MAGVELAEEMHEIAGEAAMVIEAGGVADLRIVEDSRGLRLGAWLGKADVKAVVGEAAADGVEVFQALLDSIEEGSEGVNLDNCGDGQTVHPGVEGGGMIDTQG